jgi:hypothetical protein
LVSGRKRRVSESKASKRRSGSRGQPEVPARSPQPDWLTLATSAVVVGLAGLLYWRTCARDIVVGDTPEFVTAAITLGVPHPSGYALFTIVGHLFALLPIAPLPFRVNLMSVVCGAATAGLVFWTAFRLTGERAAAAAAALVLALSPIFWEWSLAAEVFPLNNLLSATVIYLLVRWQEQPQRTGALVMAAWVFGLALTNQLTIVLLAPAVLFLLIRNRATLLARWRTLAACVAALLIGLLPYAYLPWAAARHPVVNWGGISSLADLTAHILRKDYGTGRLVSSGELAGGSPVLRIAALFASFGLLMGLLLLLGAIQAYRRRRWYFWFSLLAFGLAGPVFIAYANLNLEAASGIYVLERFFLLSHVVLAPLMAFGAALAAEGIAARVPSIRAHAKGLVAVAVLLIALGGVFRSYAAIDQSGNRVARRFAEDIFAALEPGTILLAGGDEVDLPLLYLQAVEGYRPDVTLVIMPLLPGDWYVRQLRERYPNLAVPFAHYDGRLGTIKALIDANRKRPIAVVGNLPDESTKGSYWFCRHGLVAIALPMDQDVKLRELTADNQRLLSRHRPPSMSTIKTKSFERRILTRYATIPLVVGQEWEKVRSYSEAREWYQRALALDPDLSLAREGLARIAQP